MLVASVLRRASSVRSLGQSNESDIIEAPFNQFIEDPYHKGYIPYRLMSELPAIRLRWTFYFYPLDFNKLLAWLERL